MRGARANARFLDFDAATAPPMNLSWLEDFLALAASGNFSRAADERHMTQPAFSRRVRALEDWLGVDLFDRSSQPAQLTETGNWFRQVAQDLQAEVARIPGEARAIAEARSTTLVGGSVLGTIACTMARLAFQSTSCRYTLPGKSRVDVVPSGRATNSCFRLATTVVPSLVIAARPY